MELAGHDPDGQPVYFDRDYVQADKRIALGFIEPHLMAGFSGGYKAIMPGIADIDAILRYHNAARIGHPRSTWGVLEHNPTQELIRHNGSLLPVDFCINVTLNRQREITRFFCGDVIAAHEQGAAFCKETTMIACDRPYPIVITTNSGYPLDQNLYQTDKGLSAAAQIVEEGGLIICASECSDGFPVARQLPPAALRSRHAARSAGRHPVARLRVVRSMGGADSRRHLPEGARGAVQHPARRRSPPRLPRTD